MSTRKPHNHLDGYVCELRSKHPKLPGYFVIFDRDNGGETVTGTDGNRWGVLHMNGGIAGCVVTLTNLPDARSLMKDMADGSNVADFGQNSSL